MADTSLAELAHRLEPLLEEFLVEAHRVMDEDSRKDAVILKDYMMARYPRIVVFLACADTMAQLAHNAPH